MSSSILSFGSSQRSMMRTISFKMNTPIHARLSNHHFYHTSFPNCIRDNKNSPTWDQGRRQEAQWHRLSPTVTLPGTVCKPSYSNLVEGSALLFPIWHCQCSVIWWFVVALHTNSAKHIGSRYVEPEPRVCLPGSHRGCLGMYHIPWYSLYYKSTSANSLSCVNLLHSSCQ